MRSRTNRIPVWMVALLLLIAPALLAQTQTDTASLDTSATTDTVTTDTTVTVTETATETIQGETVEPTDTAPTTTYYEEDDADDVDEDRGAAVCATCAGLSLAFPLILLGISIAIAFWIYRDATERGITSAVLWAILGFLFNILGLVIYLIARKGMTPPAAPGSTTMPPPPPPA